MANYKIKSDYKILDKERQKTEKGHIYERDIMTINPFEDLFIPGQDVIQSDSNFKFSVRTDIDQSKKHTKDAWVKPPSGDEEYWVIGDVDSSPVSDETEIVIKPDYTSLKDFAYYGSAIDMIRATVNHVLLYFPAELYFSENKFNEEVGMLSSHTDYNTYGEYYTVHNSYKIDIDTDFINESKVDNPYRYFCLHAIDYDVYNDGVFESSGITKGTFIENSGYTCGDGLLGEVVLESSNFSATLLVYLYNNEKHLLYNDSSLKYYSIRPNDVIVNEYYATIDEFESVLVNRETRPLYKAVFETPYETEDGNRYRMVSYVWPSENEWNPIIDGGGYSTYLNSLIELATFHDEYDSNIIWRMLTHEAIKNLDWTFFRENGETVEDMSHIDSSKVEAMIQLYGRQFDGLKRYIDSIKYTNNVTYNEKNNIPNYLLTDCVETGGLDAILPIQTGKTDVLSDALYSARTEGYSEVDTNNFLMRVLKINEPYINSLKGTRYGIETILRILGIKKDEYCLQEFVTVASGMSGYCGFDENIAFEITYDEPVGGCAYPTAKNVAIVNSNKNFGFSNDYISDFDGIAVKPFRCIDKNKWVSDDKPTYYVIPWYENGKHYDGNWYFQSNGGWGKTDKEKIDNPVVEGGVTQLTDYPIYDESQSYLKIAKDINEMLGYFKTEVDNDMVCYVTDLTAWTGSTANTVSHYFVLKNIENVGKISNDGWRNVPISEIRNASTNDGKKVVYLENIKELTEGNNPHVSNGKYDDGLDYLKNLNQIFRYQVNLGDNGLLMFSEADKQAISDYKFGIITESSAFTQDNRKCDYYYNNFVSSKLQDKTEYAVDLSTSTDVSELKQGKISSVYTNNDTMCVVCGYTGTECAFNPETKVSKDNKEPAANSLINIKNMRLTFSEAPIDGCGDSGSTIQDKWQDYITNVVMNYVKQMLPSTSIFLWGFGDVTSASESKYFTPSVNEVTVPSDNVSATFNFSTNYDLDDLEITYS